ncbi:MAG: hypothetical protein AABY22_05120, partial [Nanoarchaeota archaeon]
MKIDIFDFIDNENFLIKEGYFCGIPSLLVTPNHIGTKFSKETLMFRSSVWAKPTERYSQNYTLLS